ALALLHHVENLPAQLLGEIGVRRQQAFVLADHAAQLAGQVLEAVALRVVPERQRIDREGGGAEGKRQRNEHDGEQALHVPAPSSARIFGSSSLAITAGVKGPMCL